MDVEETAILHVKINVGFLSRHLSNYCRSPYKSREAVQGSHISVEQLQEDGNPARTKWSDPEDVIGVLVKTSISNCEYGTER